MEFGTQQLFSVPCDQVGRLVLIGVLERTATLMAFDLRILDPAVFKRHMDAKFKSVVVTEPVDNTRKVTSVIFQCDFMGRLRNPRGFLKALRRKLQRVISSAERDAMHVDDLVEPIDEWEDSVLDAESDEDICPDCGQCYDKCQCEEDHDENARDYREQKKLAQKLPSFIPKGDTRFFS